MLITDKMRKAFHSVTPPKNFGVSIAEHSDNGILLFLEVIADEQSFFLLDDYGKRQAVEYMARVKFALEDSGAVVQLTRKSAKK
jgi:hypothetical protein